MVIYRAVASTIQATHCRTASSVLVSEMPMERMGRIPPLERLGYHIGPVETLCEVNGADSLIIPEFQLILQSRCKSVVRSTRKSGYVQRDARLRPHIHVRSRCSSRHLREAFQFSGDGLRI